MYNRIVKYVNFLIMITLRSNMSGNACLPAWMDCKELVAGEAGICERRYRYGWKSCINFK